MTEQTNTRRYFWWALIGAWGTLSLFMASQIVTRGSGGEASVSWYNAILFELLYCSLWISLAPVTLWLAKQFPLRSKKFFAGIVVHLMTGAMLSIITMGIRMVLRWIFVHKMMMPLTLDYVVSNMTAALDFGMMSYLVNVLFSYAYVFYTQVRERELRALKLEAELGQAQLLALKMQLHPHFFFNTLNHCCPR